MRSSRVYQITRTTRLCPCPLWSGLSALQAVGPSGAPAAKDVLLALGGVGDLSRAVGQADEEGRLLLELALVAGDGDLGLDRQRGSPGPHSGRRGCLAGGADLPRCRRLPRPGR